MLMRGLSGTASFNFGMGHPVKPGGDEEIN
jgi:hypothetical protein